MNTPLPLMLSVKQENLLRRLVDRPSFIMECGYGEIEMNRIAHIFFTNTYYHFDRELLNNLTNSARWAGWII